MKDPRRKGLADRILESGNGVQSSLDEASRLLRNDVAKAGSRNHPAPPPPEAGVVPGPPPVEPENRLPATNGLIKRAYHYAEIHRLREKIVSALREREQKTVLATGPHDNSGTSTIMALLAYNAAFYTGMNILLADLNMRNPSLHEHFGKHMDNGFRETAAGLVKWQETLKETDLPRLKLITAGEYEGDLFPFINRPFLEQWLNELKETFDILFLDTSPVLLENRNNVDPVLLSLICDMSILVVQDKKTRKSDLREAVKSIEEGGGRIEGVVYNQQFHGIFLPLKRGAKG